MKTFSTKSLNVVAWMLQKGYEIKNMYQVDDNVVFHFDYSNEIIQALDDYKRNIELRQFLIHYKQLKQKIKAIKK